MNSGKILNFKMKNLTELNLTELNDQNKKNKMKLINYGNFEINHELGFELGAKYFIIGIEFETSLFLFRILVLEVINKKTHCSEEN